MQTIYTRAGILTGIRQALPLAISDAAVGVVFGVLARQVGLSPFEAATMSSLVFAGSAQFVAVSLWSPTLPAVTIILTTLIINLRYILMSSSLYPWFSNLSFLRAAGLLFFLSDESWALTIRNFTQGSRDGLFLLGAGLIIFVAWLGGTLTGLLLGSAIADPAQWGLDFAFYAVFAALVVGMWEGKASMLPWLAAGAVALLTFYLLPSPWYIVCGGMAGSLVGGLRHAK